MKDKLLRQARREYAPRQRMLTLAALAPVFLVLLPAGLIRLSGGWIRRCVFHGCRVGVSPWQRAR